MFRGILKKFEVKFKDGETVISNMELSFNKEGKLVGEIKEQD